MNKIQIVSWLLTRRCNLSCSYCRISKDYDSPEEYPKLYHYQKREMRTIDVIETLRRLKLHNPNHFNILYGGEPTLRKDLHEIVDYCNKQNINYTIITNNSDKVQPLLNRLIEKVGYLQGLTSSVDPIIFTENGDPDILKKSNEGLKRLVEFKNKGVVKDVVAEITVTNDSMHYLYHLVENLTDLGINSDITFVDIAKNKYYDFSNVTDPDVLVYKSQELKEVIQKIIDNKLDVHMRDILLPEMYDILPSELDCRLEDGIHNITLDSDASCRLCLRIRGVYTPSNFYTSNFIDENGILNEYLHGFMVTDKKKYCEKCNWSCTCMSRLLMQNDGNVDDLLHTEVRK